MRMGRPPSPCRRTARSSSPARPTCRADSNDFALARYCPDGKLDDGVNCGGPAFGSGGKTTTDFFAEWDSLAALLLLPDGKILVGGTASRDVTGGGWDEDFALARYRPMAAWTAASARTVRRPLDFGAEEEQGNALALQADGKLLISGESGGHLAMARYLPARPPTYLPIVRE